MAGRGRARRRAPGVGESRLAIEIGRAVFESACTLRPISGAAPLAALANAGTDGNPHEQRDLYGSSRVLLVERLCKPPFERRNAHHYCDLVAQPYKQSGLLITANQMLTH